MRRDRRVAINADHLGSGFQHGPRIASCAEGAIDNATARHRLQRRQHFCKQHGHMRTTRLFGFGQGRLAHIR